jgi:hypothetical protein
MGCCVYSALALVRETEDAFGRISPLYEKWLFSKEDSVFRGCLSNLSLPLRIGGMEWNISVASKAKGGRTVDCTTELAVPTYWRIPFLTGKILRLRALLGREEKRPPHQERYYGAGGNANRTVPELGVEIHSYDGPEWTPETFCNVKIRLRSVIVHELTHFADERLPRLCAMKPLIEVGTHSIAAQLNYLRNPTELRAKVRDQVEAAIQRDIPFGVQLKIHLGRVRQVMRRKLPIYRPGLDLPMCAPEAIDVAAADAIKSLNEAYREEFLRDYPGGEDELGNAGESPFQAPGPFA